MSSNSVTITLAFRVMPGRAADFHSWGWGVLGASARQPGFLGGGVLVDQTADWHVIYRFDRAENARAWENSVAWAEWAARLQELAQETGRQVLEGSSAWFEAQTERAPAPPAPGPPPKWKLWFVNMSAVFPPVLLFNVVVIPYLGGLNPLIRTLVLCLCVTALVTWILMPRLQRFLKKWLYPPLQALRGRHKRRTA